jgi:hypothetical protein
MAEKTKMEQLCDMSICEKKEPHLHIAVRVAIEQQLLLDVGRQVGKHGLVARAQSRRDGGLGDRGAGRVLGEHIVDLVDQRVELGDELDQALRSRERRTRG